MSELRKWWLEIARGDLEKAEAAGNYDDARRVWDELRGAWAYTGCSEAEALRNKAYEVVRRIADIEADGFNPAGPKLRETAEDLSEPGWATVYAHIPAY